MFVRDSQYLLINPRRINPGNHLCHKIRWILPTVSTQYRLVSDIRTRRHLPVRHT